MSVFALLAYLTNGVGVVLVCLGLYRRDPRAQQRMRTLRGRVGYWLRRLARRPPRRVKVTVNSALSMASAMSASLRVRPGPRADDATTEQRLGWLERAADAAFQDLDAETTERRADVADLREKVTAVESALRNDVTDLRRVLDESKVPEHYEWWGAALVVTGLLFAVLDATLAGS